MSQTVSHLRRPELQMKPVCVNCSKSLREIVRFYVKRNGVYIPYGHDSAQAGDLLACPVCHTEIVLGFGTVLGKTSSAMVLNSSVAILKEARDFEQFSS